MLDNLVVGDIIGMYWIENYSISIATYCQDDMNW